MPRAASKPTKTRTTPYDVADHLRSSEDMAAYLDAALEGGDSALVIAALCVIARAKGMSDVTREAGLGGESLDKTQVAAGNHNFATVLKLVDALGLQLHAAPLNRAGSN